MSNYDAVMHWVRNWRLFRGVWSPRFLSQRHPDDVVIVSGSDADVGRMSMSSLASANRLPHATSGHGLSEDPTAGKVRLVRSRYDLMRDAKR